MSVRRGTSNANRRGSSETRRRRREWLVQTYRADGDILSGDRARVWWFTNHEFNAWVNGWVAKDETPLTSMVWECPPVFEMTTFMVAHGEGDPCCRCYRCGDLLTVNTVTVDRIIPGALGGTYRRSNIRPACARCNSETGGAVRSNRKAVAA